MSVDRKHVGKRYGPFVYEVGAQKVLEFALAISGGVPSTAFAEGRGDLRPAYEDGRLAPPAFANVFAIQPFSKACLDPELGLDVLMLVHGEQAYEFLEPIRAGDVITTTGAIADVYEKSGKDFVVVEAESRNQRGELCVRSRWTAVIRSA